MGAREEITHLMNRYGFVIDTGDMEGFADLFAHGEWTMDGLDPKIGKQAILDMSEGIIIYDDGTTKTKHLTTNVDLDVDEDRGTATSQCYVTVLQQTDDFPLQTIFSGHYFDDFERVDGNWRFKKRLIRHQLIGNMSAHIKATAAIVADA